MSLDFNDILNGLSLAYQGFRKALATPKILRYFYKSFLFLAISIFSLHILATTLFYSPLYILQLINWVFSALFAYDSSSFDQLVEEAISVLRSRVMALPLSGLFVFRYVYPYPMNNIFLASIQTLSTPHYEALSQRDYKVNYWDELRDSASRSFKRLRNITIAVGLSFLPTVGMFVLPLASFYLTSKSVGLKLSLALSTLPLTVPGTKPFIVWFLSTIYGTRSLSRELLEPYFGRLGFTAKDRAKYFKGRESILLGFSLGYYLLISNIPVIGPIFYVFAQSATATFIVKTTSALEHILEEKEAASELKSD